MRADSKNLVFERNFIATFITFTPNLHYNTQESIGALQEIDKINYTPTLHHKIRRFC